MWVYFGALELYNMFLCHFRTVLITVALSVQSEIGEYDSSSFVFLLMIVLAIQGLLWFYINFKITCSNSVKNAIGILIENVLSL